MHEVGLPPTELALTHALAARATGEASADIAIIPAEGVPAGATSVASLRVIGIVAPLGLLARDATALGQPVTAAVAGWLEGWQIDRSSG